MFKSKILISTSILAFDLLNLEKEIELLEKSGVDKLHLDIMDGNFVNNMSFGIEFVEQIKQITSLPLEIHLMVKNPERYIDSLKGVESIFFHIENTVNHKRLLTKISSAKIKAGIVVNPYTSIDDISQLYDNLDYVLIMSVVPGACGQLFISKVLDKITFLKKNSNVKIIVDGGINNKTGKMAINSGADILVSGSYIKSNNYEKAIKLLKN